MKKIICLVLIFTLAFTSVGSVFAVGSIYAEKDIKNNFQKQVNVLSEEFPDAYIEKEIIDTEKILKIYEGDKLYIKDKFDGKNLAIYNISELQDNNIRKIIRATVYVEDTYTLEKKDFYRKESGLLSEHVTPSYVQTLPFYKKESRLLSEEEVNKIGKENFKYNYSGIGWDRTDRYQLDLFITVIDANPTGDRKRQYQVIGQAQWRGLAIPWEGSNTGPARREANDYAGFYWGGGLSSENHNCSAVYSDGSDVDVYLKKAGPNSSLVWDFNPYKHRNFGHPEWMSNLTANVNLYTRQLEGRDTTIAFKYIHNYSRREGTIILSYPVGFSLTSVRDQWSVTVLVDEIEY